MAYRRCKLACTDLVFSRETLTAITLVKQYFKSISLARYPVASQRQAGFGRHTVYMVSRWLEPEVVARGTDGLQ